MKNILKIILPFLIFASALFAQDNAQIIGKNLRNLEYRLQYLQNIAQKYHAGQRVLNGLQAARENLEKAKSSLIHWYNPGELAEAIKFYKKAKALADLAARALLFKPLARAKKDFDRLMQRAEGALQRTDRAEARYMLIRARAFQKKAEQAYRDFRLIQGQEYQRIATYFATKALELADSAGQSDRNRSNYEELWRNLRILHNTLLSANTNNANIARLLEDADSYLKLAKKFYEKGDLAQAMLRLQIGERLLYRAVDLQQSSGEGQKDQLRSDLFSLKNYLNGVERTLRDAPGNSAGRLLRKARQFARSAQRDFDNGNYREAQRKISLAQRMATKAFRFASADVEKDSGPVTDRIREAQHILSLQKEKINKDDGTAAFLLKQAEVLLENARKAAQEGHTDQAAWQVRLTYRIAGRIDFLLTNKPAAHVDAQRLKKDLQEAGGTLHTLSTKNDLNERVKAQLPFLQKMLAEADRNLRAGHLRLAAELNTLIQKQLRIVLREALNRQKR